MLAAHPLVVGPANETHVYDELYYPIVEHGLDDAARRALLDRFDARPHGDDVGVHLLVTHDQLARDLAAAAASGRPRAAAAEDVIATVLGRFAASAALSPDSVFVEKTPSHLFHALRILHRFPDARIVEVLRDGRDVCVSMQHRAAEATWVPSHREEQIRTWVESVQIGLSARAAPEAADRWHVVRFEAAKDDARRTIAELFTICHLPFDGALVEAVASHTDFARLTDIGEGKMFRRGLVGGWRTEFTDGDQELFTRLAGGMLALAGYEL
jgi:hypothetical protein